MIGYNNLGCSDTDMIHVGMYDVLNAAILGDDSICVGESTNLSCAGNGAFAWAPSTGLNTTTGPNVVATPTSTITYTVTFTDANGCVTSDAVSIQVDQCTGIAEPESPEPALEIYPNPGSGNIQIMTNSRGPRTVEIVDVLGQTVFSATLTGNTSILTVDASGFANGTYLVLVKSGNGLISEKLVIAQ